MNVVAGEKKRNEKEDLRARVLNPAKMIAYQKGAIVSRTLIQKKTGTVTLFAFDKDQGLSEHTVPFDAMVNVLAGEVEVAISRKPFRLKRGETVILPADEPHALKALKKFKMLLTMIRG